jgi:hypothetical protein
LIIKLLTHYVLNITVPTPFYHLFVANELLARRTLPSRVQQFLEAYRDAFDLGNTAPDVQTISGQSRFSTHFFRIPIHDGDAFPWDQMFISQACLAHPWLLPPEQAAFLAGYLCHLQADWLWMLEIFIPFFGPSCAWDTFPRRLCLHNGLRAYLDENIRSQLPANLGERLTRVESQHWLPFTEDEYLHAWRDFIVEQLQPEAVSRTVEIFASRDGISQDEFNHILKSQDLIEEHIFTQLPRQRLEIYLQLIYTASLCLLSAYLT